MPGRIVVVHDHPSSVEGIESALRTAGYDVATFADTMTAIDALDRAQDIDMLITRTGFPPGQPHGVALGKMARVKRRDIKVLFVGAAERLEHTQGVGEFLAAPVTARDVVAMVGEMLA
jgi:DNA-binding NtrC family response regulator